MGYYMAYFFHERSFFFTNGFFGEDIKVPLEDSLRNKSQDMQVLIFRYFYVSSKTCLLIYYKNLWASL